jgi:Ulp1 family protease
MKGDGSRYMNSIFHYLQDDWHHARGFELPEIRQWSLINESSVPIQENSYDCGAFVCLFAACMAINYPMTFTQLDAPKMRLKLAHLICIHRNAHADVSEAINHDTRGIATPISNTKKTVT